MQTTQNDPYAAWLQTLSVDELANERYTLRNEAQFLGISKDEMIDRENAIEVEQGRRGLAALA